MRTREREMKKEMGNRPVANGGMERRCETHKKRNQKESDEKRNYKL